MTISALAPLSKQAGNYVIVGCAAASFQVEIKKFGQLDLPAGYYLYCGSARGPGGLQSRVTRHLKTDTKSFWHYDYLKRYLTPRQVWWQANPQNYECETAQFLFNQPGAQCTVRGFGASDCRRDCPAHLVYFAGAAQVENAWQKVDMQNWDYRRIYLEAE
ncbi:MAG: hypothetical protein PWQ55_1917 [Chloroflexota bacterium]|nr:hypothetical protein [Chloroflexota bacterium]